MRKVGATYVAPVVSGQPRKSPKRSATELLACTHNRGVYDDYEAHAVCGCQSNQQVSLTIVAECSLYGDVTPLAKRTREGLRSCVGCGDWRAQGEG